MGILEDELSEVRRVAEGIISNSKLEACVPAMVRLNIEDTKYKQMVVCMQFQPEYPKTIALIELRSRYVSDKLLDGLTKMCDDTAKKYIGKPQVLHIFRFVRNFMEENPLICCSEDITRVRKKLRASDELKPRQKTSSIILRINEGEWFVKYNILVPDNYPDKQVSIEEKECNFPKVLRRWFLAQSVEIARRCTEPPVRKKPKDPPFVQKPSLEPMVAFLIEEAHKYPAQPCAVCTQLCFPDDVKELETDVEGDNYVERIYCGHIYHYKCLDVYIRTPPFHGGKKCHTCKQRIYHDRWKLSPGIAEARWAHKQAKQRELDEVVDFLS